MQDTCSRKKAIGTWYLICMTRLGDERRSGSPPISRYRAIESGLLEKAQQNAQDLLTRLICSYPQVREKYTISFTQLS